MKKPWPHGCTHVEELPWLNYESWEWATRAQERHIVSRWFQGTLTKGLCMISNRSCLTWEWLFRPWRSRWKNNPLLEWAECLWWIEPIATFHKLKSRPLMATSLNVGCSGNIFKLLIMTSHMWGRLINTLAGCTQEWIWQKCDPRVDTNGRKLLRRCHVSKRPLWLP